MGFYGYCVAPYGHEPQAVRGLAGHHVAGRVVGSVVVWLSEIERPEPTIAAIQEHNAVVEGAVTKEVTPVPLRFGQWSPEVDTFERVIAEKADWYAARLRVFAGALEFGIRIASPEKRATAQDVRPIEAKSGLEYMTQLRDSVRSTQRQAEESARLGSRINEVMRDVVREERTEDARTPHGILTVAHLVARDNFEVYQERAASLREMFPELRFLVSGPWVPYSFAT